MNSSGTRRELRKELRSARRALSPEQQQQASRCIIHRLYQELFFLKSKNIAFYWPADGEVDLRTLMTDTGKIWHLPLISDTLRAWETKRLFFQPFDQETPSALNKYGIVEPLADARTEIQVQMLDIVLLPLVGFDRQGNRLGMGKGYYDRTFAKQLTAWNRPKLVGIAHSVQECETLATQNWDIPLDIILTEDETIMLAGRQL